MRCRAIRTAARRSCRLLRQAAAAEAAFAKACWHEWRLLRSPPPELGCSSNQEIDRLP